MLVYDLVDSRSEVAYTGGGTASSVTVEKDGAWAGELVEHAEIDVSETRLTVDGSIFNRLPSRFGIFLWQVPEKLCRLLPSAL